ncbi:hypothetical protein [Microbacterium sp. 13-71-7]|jgi:hypothetical protein|uniref:rolling circle replication-associated protein n=1 Tax=Microbacterium sp. 13-71-7 TaxID=1970399 RepID=UPI000BC70834|nr:hypothetical protein [Microbacterium sp. 13-71-7]OZB85733.1 MAG: hypothetical protein B7X32_02370 [Microbacterium sp. 13-71-7]
MVARTLTQAQVDALRIPTADEIRNVAAALPQLEQSTVWTPGLGDGRHWDARPRLHLEVASGMLRLFRTSQHLKDAAFDRALAEKMRDDTVRAEAAAYRESMALLTKSELALLGAPKVSTSSDRRITSWTRRSRNRMQQQLNRLDFTPLFEDGLEPAMVTLTMPGQWEHLAPTPAAFKKIVERFQLYYERAWGVRPRGVWKLEFQKRGAPHLHILMTPPAGTAGREKVEFRAWLSKAWAQCVGAEGDERVKHERAGTGIDYVGDQYRDPRRIAAYFGKHGFFSAKDYQNQVPQIWLDAIAGGATGARFWGVWGLEKASSVVLLDETGSASVETLLDPLGIVGAAGVLASAVKTHIADYQ